MQATRALSGSQPSFEHVDTDEDDDDGAPGLKDGFDWYMPPGDRAKYESIYGANSDSGGDVTFASLEPLYSSLDVPDTDVRSAWNLVNPSAGPAIGKDACLAFLHVLNNRHEGYRIPKSVPPSLRMSFERNHINYQVDRAGSPAGSGQSGRYDDSTSTGRKTRFGDTYLSRLGLGGGGGSYRHGGTDFGGGGGGGGSSTTPDWEEVRLKKQLAEMDAKIEAVERRAEAKRAKRVGARDSKPALVRRELGQLLEWKEKELRELEAGPGRADGADELKGVRAEIDVVREQVEGLERHWKERQAVLAGLREKVDEVKR